MRCHYCEWRCELGWGKSGKCGMYHAAGDVVRERFPGKWSSFTVARIESIPFYHAYPGSRSLTIGTSGCNFSCKYCANAFIAKQYPAFAQETMASFTPRELVHMAVKLDCHSIVFNVNEPTMSIPSLLEMSKEASETGIRMGCLTNGYTTPEATELFASIFSFFNISLKGLSEAFNREYIGIPSVEPILRTIRMLAGTRHVEVTTPVIQGANDHELDEIAGFIHMVDPTIPWHVLRLLPEDEMKNTKYPDIEQINKALNSARRRLPYIYFHNFIGSDWVNTACPKCGATVIERFSLGCGGDKLQRLDCVDGRCPACGGEINILREMTEQLGKEVAI